MAVINTNYQSLIAQNTLTKSKNTLGSAIERLSFGLRINSAKDDGAGQPAPSISLRTSIA